MSRIASTGQLIEHVLLYTMVRPLFPEQGTPSQRK